jgi:hypothetical protein
MGYNYRACYKLVITVTIIILLLLVVVVVVVDWGRGYVAPRPLMYGPFVHRL